MFELDMHYLGQTHTIGVPLPVTLDTLDALDEKVIRNAFETSYANAFSRLLPGTPVRLVNLRTAAIGRRPAFDLMALAPRTAAGTRCAVAERQVWFDGGMARDKDLCPAGFAGGRQYHRTCYPRAA